MLNSILLHRVCGFKSCSRWCSPSVREAPPSDRDYKSCIGSHKVEVLDHNKFKTIVNPFILLNWFSTRATGNKLNLKTEKTKTIIIGNGFNYSCLIIFFTIHYFTIISFFNAKTPMKTYPLAAPLPT